MSHHADNYYSNKTPPYPVSASDLDLSVNYVNAQAAAIRSVDKGGTGFSTYTAGDLLYGSGATLVKLGAVAVGSYLRSNGTSTPPSWATLNKAAVEGLHDDQNVLFNQITADGNVLVDQILENTPAAGVTIEGVLIKDSDVTLSGGQTLTTDIISEATGAAGVTADGVLLKDGGITLTSALDMGSQLINQLATPVVGTDATTKDYVDSLVNGLDWQESVIDKDTTSQPGAPTTGDRYIIPAGATGAEWVGNDEKITEWNGTSWLMFAPTQGQAAFAEDEGVSYNYTGGDHPSGTWVLFAATVAHDSTVGGTSAVAHGATGAVVGTTNAQTLTNKELTSPGLNEATALTATSTELNQLDGVTLGAITAGNIPKLEGVPADNDYLKLTATGMEGRTVVELVGDIGSQAPLTVGSANAEGSNTNFSRTDHVHAREHAKYALTEDLPGAGEITSLQNIDTNVITGTEWANLAASGSYAIGAQEWSNLNNSGGYAIGATEWSNLNNSGSYTISTSDWQKVSLLDQNLRTTDTVKFDQVEIGGGTPANSDVELHVYGTSDLSGWKYGILQVEENHSDSISGCALSLQFGSISAPDSFDSWIYFLDSAGNVEGDIDQSVSYNPFTGSHPSNTDDTDYMSWKKGMVLVSTGEKIGEGDISNAYVKTQLSATPNDKRVMGVYKGVKNQRIDNLPSDLQDQYMEEIDYPLIDGKFMRSDKKYLDNNKVEIRYNAVGEGKILVCNVNGNVGNGDYVTTTTVTGYAGLQDDDILHSYTVAKVTEDIDWSSIPIDSEVGHKVFLAGCTYHCG